jgi:hypothetical protein
VAVAAVIMELMISTPFPEASWAKDNLKASVEDYLSAEETEPTREDWLRRVEQAKRRAIEVGRQRRENPTIYTPIPEDPEVVSTERVLNDDSLQNGDIIATKGGMFVYKGRTDRPRKIEDFVPVERKPPAH